MPEAAEGITQKELAKRLGITVRMVRNHHGSGIPRLESGLYPWPAARDWYIAFKQDEKLERSGARSPVNDYQREQVRQKQLQNVKLERELALMEGDLLFSKDHNDIVAQLAELVSAWLANIPGAWPPLLTGIEDPREMSKQLRKLVAEAQEDLANLLDDRLEPEELERIRSDAA